MDDFFTTFGRLLHNCWTTCAQLLDAFCITFDRPRHVCLLGGGEEDANSIGSTITPIRHLWGCGSKTCSIHKKNKLAVLRAVQPGCLLCALANSQDSAPGPYSSCHNNTRGVSTSYFGSLHFPPGPHPACYDYEVQSILLFCFFCFPTNRAVITKVAIHGDGPL